MNGNLLADLAAIRAQLAASEQALAEAKQLLRQFSEANIEAVCELAALLAQAVTLAEAWQLHRGMFDLEHADHVSVVKGDAAASAILEKRNG